MTTDPLEQLSDTLAERVAAAARFTVAVGAGRRTCSGILWKNDVVVTSEQLLSDQPAITVMHGSTTLQASLAGRDPGTNVAVLRLPQSLATTLPPAAPSPPAGSLALVVGAGEGEGGTPTARLSVVHASGPEWHSQAGGRIETLIRLDTRLGADEGGPVLTPAGKLIGMSTSGPRRTALVIPAATIERVLVPLLTKGYVARGWLGVGLQQIQVPERMRDAAGRDAGMMVVALAPASPAEQAGVLPGDIILEVDGRQTGRARGLSTALADERIGQPATLKLLRAGEIRMVTVTIGTRPIA